MALAALGVWAAQAQDISGDWQGTPKAGQHELRVILQIVKADSGDRKAVPALILKQDAPPETRRANEEAAKLLKNGKLVHIDGARHNLHHDQRQRTLDVLRPLASA